MGLFERRSSKAGLEDIERSDAPRRPDSGTPPPPLPSAADAPVRAGEPSESSLSFANRMLASKHTSKLKNDSHSSSHHPFAFIPHSASNSRGSSTKTSSSSLQALNEDSVTDGSNRFDHYSYSSSPFGRRLSQKLEHNQRPLAPTTQSINTSADLPVYPDQSYAVLQSQVYPPPYKPFLRGRSSYPSHLEYPRQYDHSLSFGAQTVDNTPVSSPGLFAARSARTSPSIGSDDETFAFSPSLHPTHLQPPKE